MVSSSPLIQLMAVLGVTSGIASIIALLIYPEESYWPVLFFLTVVIFLLVKIIKYLFPK